MSGFVHKYRPAAVILFTALTLSSCLQETGEDLFAESAHKALKFDIIVSRDGKVLTKTASGALLDSDLAFGLIGLNDMDRSLVIDNKAIYENQAGERGDFFDEFLWTGKGRLSLSAYYPYVEEVTYDNLNSVTTYSVSYSATDVDAGPLVSKTVEATLISDSAVPLAFQHVTNDVGFMIRDVTADENLRGLIHLRRLVVHNLATEGTYVNNVSAGKGSWSERAGYTDVVVFDGDDSVPCSQELFVGADRLCTRKDESSRFYAVPDVITPTRQYVEVFYDVEEFALNGFTYSAVEGLSEKYLLYGLLPENRLEEGKQYTFHLGLNLASVYSEIVFDPTVSSWESKIYENNADF